MFRIGQNLSSQVLNDSKDFADTTVLGRLFHGSLTLIGNKKILRFSLTLWVTNFKGCPLFSILCDILLFSKGLVQIHGHKCCVLFCRILSCLLLIFDMLK